MDKEGLAYCAGLYEGEGTVSASPQHRSKHPIGTHFTRGRYYTNSGLYRISLCVGMTNWEPLYTFADYLDIGSVRGPFQNKSYRDMYEFRVNTFQHVQYIIAILWPWLSPKRKNQYKEVVRKYMIGRQA